MVKYARRVFLGHWFLRPRKDYFCTPQSCPSCQRLVKNLLWVKGRGGTLSVLGCAHFELFLRCHQGIILSHGELWAQVHTMDYIAATKGSICAWADEFVPYPAHKVGYDPGGYWWSLAYSTWGPTIVSFSFLVSAQLTIFSSFLGPTSGASLRP